MNLRFARQVKADPKAFARCGGGVVFHGDLFGVLPQYRGGELQATRRLLYYSRSHYYSMGLRWEFGAALSPISQHLLQSLGGQPLPSCSVSFKDFEYRGLRPFAPISFDSVVPGGASTLLGFATNVARALSRGIDRSAGWPEFHGQNALVSNMSTSDLDTLFLFDPSDSPESSTASPSRL